MGRKTISGRKGRGKGQASEPSHSQEENPETQSIEVKTTDLPPTDSSKTSTPTKSKQTPLQKTPSQTKLNLKENVSHDHPTEGGGSTIKEPAPSQGGNNFMRLKRFYTKNLRRLVKKKMFK